MVKCNVYGKEISEQNNEDYEGACAKMKKKKNQRSLALGMINWNICYYIFYINRGGH